MNTTTATLKSYGYGIVHSFRPDNRGGGTSLVYNSSLQFNAVHLYLNETSTFEYTTGTLKCSSDMKVLFICIYRTGPTSSKFFEEFDNLLGAASLKSDYIILAGDFNIHTESTNSSSTALIKVAASYGFKQVVCQPTHLSGGTIDLIFDNSNLILSSTVQILDDCNFSDHFPIFCSTRNFDTNLKHPKIIHTRNLKSVDKDQIALDLYDQVSHFNLHESFPESCQEFFACTAEVLDGHAPLTGICTPK